MRRSAMAAVAVVSSAGLLLSACSKAEDGTEDTPKGAGANAATKGVVNESTAKGGTVTYASTDTPSPSTRATCTTRTASTSAASTRVR